MPGHYGTGKGGKKPTKKVVKKMSMKKRKK